MDGTGQLFESFLHQFSDGESVQVITYPTDRFIPQAELINYVSERLPEDRPLVVLGESYSGPIALSLAASSNLNIAAVVLVATFARYPSGFLKSVSRWLPISWLLHLPIPGLAIRRYCFGQYKDPRLYAALRASIRANDPAVLARRMRDGRIVDVTPLLKNITVPCLSIRASEDRLVPAKAIDDLKQNIRKFDEVNIPGPHFILQTQPRACYEAMHQWLDRVNLV